MMPEALVREGRQIRLCPVNQPWQGILFGARLTGSSDETIQNALWLNCLLLGDLACDRFKFVG